MMLDRVCRPQEFCRAGRVRALAGVLAVSWLAWTVIKGGRTALAGEPDAPADPPGGLLAKTVEHGIQYLIVHGQAEDGSFSGFSRSAGPTALAVTALLRHGRTARDPVVAKGLEYLGKCTRADGGIYAESAFVQNYETCAALMCFREADRGAVDQELLEKAEAFIRGIQGDEETGKEPADLGYGGVGYGGDSRPDLSNTAFLLDALVECGAGTEDEAIQKAIAFVSRCQNLESQHNTTQFAAKVNDGGFYYTPSLSQQDKSRQTPNGGLRSYGSMSYAGLKSFIYAGLDRDDPRVKAAVDWIRNNYTLEEHPGGMGEAGLYYYYHTFAKALDVLGEDYIEDADGVKHDWRKELTERLAECQQPDGSWVNTDPHWMESDPNLVTAYALLALSYCRGDSDKQDSPPQGDEPSNPAQ